MRSPIRRAGVGLAWAGGAIALLALTTSGSGARPAARFDPPPIKADAPLLRIPRPTLAAASIPAAPVGPRPVCGTRQLNGPRSAPAQATIVPAGHDNPTGLETPHTTYWFAPGVHSFGGGRFTHISPGQGDTYLGAPGAIVSGRYVNRYAFAGHAAGITIEFLTIEDFGPRGSNGTEGVVNHTSAPRWKIEHDTIARNAGAGVMLGSYDVLRDDCLSHNGQYGFNAYSPNGVRTLTVRGNEISHNDTYNWTVARPGCGCSGGGKFWNTNGAVVTGNDVVDNLGVGIWVDTDNRGFLIARNYLAHNSAEAIMYEISYNAVITHNTIIDNAWGKGPGVRGFPVSAIYISESGGDARVPSRYAGTLAVTDNVLRTNWGGVVLWENSNRFCGDGSDGLCTLVTPTTFTIDSCRTHLASSAPGQRPDYYDDCRWKTKTVTVAHNTFVFSPSHIPRCSLATWCGFNGIFSEYGSTLPWKGWVVPLRISDHQHDRFRTNSYAGPWHFDGFMQGDVVSWAQWTHGFSDDHGSGDRFDPQDAGSTFHR